ncbi:MAG: hypothetical protein CUN57_04100, partial [Phototrophicales bacterium]
KKGNSNTNERKKRFQLLVDFTGVDGMEAFVADRFKYLVDTGIPFVTRIKIIPFKPNGDICRSLCCSVISASVNP